MTGELPVNTQPEKDLPGCKKLDSWLNTTMKIKMTDGRVLIGVFVCTDKDRNVILGSCNEYLGEPDDDKEDPKTIGLAMIPGHHIVSVEMDCDQTKATDDHDVL